MKTDRMTVSSASTSYPHTHLVITSHTRAALIDWVSFNPHQSLVSLAPALIAALSERDREVCEILLTLKSPDPTDRSHFLQLTLSSTGDILLSIN